MKLFSSVLISLMFCTAAYAATPEAAYVFEYNTRGPDYIIRFDTTTDTTTEKVELPDNIAYNNMLVDEKGGAYIASFRFTDVFGRDIYYYDHTKKKVEHFANLEEFIGPSFMALTPTDLVVQIVGKAYESPRRGGVLFIDRATRKVTAEVRFKEDLNEYPQADTVLMAYDGKRTIALSSFYMVDVPSLETNTPAQNTFARRRWFTGSIYIVDTQLKKITKKIKVPDEYKYLNGICIVEDKVYLTSFRRGYADPEAGIELASNDDVMVFSISSGKLLKKIKISPHPRSIVIDRSVNKLYVLHLDDEQEQDIVEAIDTTTDKVINRINIPEQVEFGIVSPGKMYFVAGYARLKKEEIKPRMLVIDTRTDKITKTIYGNFPTVSQNNKFW